MPFSLQNSVLSKRWQIADVAEYDDFAKYSQEQRNHNIAKVIANNPGLEDTIRPSRKGTWTQRKTNREQIDRLALPVNAIDTDGGYPMLDFSNVILIFTVAIVFEWKQFPADIFYSNDT